MSSGAQPHREPQSSPDEFPPTLPDVNGIEHVLSSKEQLRSLVVEILLRSANSDDEAATMGLKERISDLEPQGQLVRAVIVEELLRFEEAMSRSISDDTPAHACFRFAQHIAPFLTLKCGEEMADNQRHRLLTCIEAHLKAANAEEQWSPGATRLLEHVIALSNNLFTSAEEITLSLAERLRLGTAFLNFLSKHEGFFHEPELSKDLVVPLDGVVTIVTKLETSKRGEVLKRLFGRVNERCLQLKDYGEGDDVLLADPIDLISDLLESEYEWSGEGETAEEQTRFGFMPQEADEMRFYQDEFSEDADDEFEDDDGELLYEESDDTSEEWIEDESQDWTGDDFAGASELDDPYGSSRDAEPSPEPHRGSETELFRGRSEEEVEASLSLRRVLTEALLKAPSLQRDPGFWHRLVFEESVYEPSSCFFVQGYARTSREALQSLLLAIPLSLEHEELFVLHLVALLEIERELEEIHGADLVTSYHKALEALAENREILELYDDYREGLEEDGYVDIPSLIDKTINTELNYTLDTWWPQFENVCELGLSADEMQSLVRTFIERVWGKQPEQAEEGSGGQV